VTGTMWRFENYVKMCNRRHTALGRNLLVMLMLWSVTGSAQVRRMPDPEKDPALYPTRALLQPAGINRYTEVLLTAHKLPVTDTSTTVSASYDASGRLLQVDECAYMGEDYLRVLPYAVERLTSPTICKRYTYTYDEAGRLLKAAQYEVLPANSYLRLIEALKEIDQQRGIQRMIARPGKDQRIADSLLRTTTLAEKSKLLNEYVYTYRGKENNPVSFEHTASGLKTEYSYQYYPDGKVRVQRVETPGLSNTKEVTENHFTYTPDGKLQSVVEYRVLDDNNMSRTGRRTYHYNRRGLPDTLRTESYTMEVLYVHEYTDTLLAAYWQITKRGGASAGDSLHVSYMYKDGVLANEVATMQYSYEQRPRISYKDYFHDSEHRLVEIREYEALTDDSDPVSQELFFYGTSSDVMTAERKIKLKDRKEGTAGN
jgi:hypothetical protein